MTEHQLQASCFEWAAWKANEAPELEMLFAIPNGGKRDKVTAARLKAEGVKPGVPDIFLAVPRSPHAGLFLEAKVGKNQLTEKQWWFKRRLIFQGYRVEEFRSLEEFQLILSNYLARRIT